MFMRGDMMFPNWWSHYVSTYSQDDPVAVELEADNTRSSTTSFRLPKTSSNHDSNRKKSKQKGTSRMSCQKSSQFSGSNQASSCNKISQTARCSHVQLVASSSHDDKIDTNKNACISASKKHTQELIKEGCRVVNLNLPLPLYYLETINAKQKQVEQTLIGESPRHPRRDPSSSLEIDGDKKQKTILKSVQFVNLIDDDQSMYAQHQRMVHKSSYFTMPTSAKSLFLVNLMDRPGSATTWKDVHPFPASFLRQSSRKKRHPSQEYPVMSSYKQCKENHILQPFFRYSLHQNTIRPTLTHIDGSQNGLLQTERSRLPTTDAQLQAGKYAGRYSYKITQLPPLETSTRLSSGENYLESLPMHTQGLNIMGHHPKYSQKTTITERVLKGSMMKLHIHNRHRKEVSGYPDPLVGGLPCYQTRLAQMMALVTETIRAEKDKALKHKSKKCIIGRSPRGNYSNYGSLGSL